MRPKALPSALKCVLVSALAASLSLVTVGASPGSAVSPAVFSGTQLFNEPFNTAFATGKGDEVLPLIAGGKANGACLTVTGNTTVIPKSCTTQTDPSNGALRLTLASPGLAGSIFSTLSVPTSKGLSATFEMHQWNPIVGSYADGLAFTLAAADPTSPVAPITTGPTGGSLGYSALRTGGLPGLEHAYLGFGFDIFGNFSNSVYEGSNCTDPPYIAVNGKVPGQAVVRGPGQGEIGYCALNSTASSTTSPPVAMHGTTRANSLITVAIGINPTARDLVDQNGLTIPAGQYILQFTPIGGTLKTLTGALPSVAQTFYGASTGPWINANGYPKQLAFGWTASTGSVVDNHEITNAQVYSLTVVPQINVAQTSYTDSAPAVGGPVTYVATPSIAAGADEAGSVTLTDTLPAGVKPESAAGNGWTCGAPSGQTISCVNSSSPFLAGSTLPVVTVEGIVTTAGMTAAGIAANTVATASSNDALPGLSNPATAAAPILPPSSVTINPASGAKAGGGSVTLGGTNVSSATTVQIGTAAEFSTGAVSVFVPCPGGVAAAGCFTVAGSTVAISAMPAHASGAVLVKVVTFGVGDTATYTYTSVPSAPTVTGAAGITSAVVTWQAPSSTGGSPILSYLVTPIRAGVRGTTVAVGPTVRTQTFNGLDPEVSYTFEVIATNVNGSGNPGLSGEVIPYTVPGVPTGVTGIPSDEAVLVSWVAPVDDGGSPLTSYTITPFIGGVAQTPVTTPDASTSFNVTGLTAGVGYKFRVRATNAAGSGAQSATSATVTPNASPTLSFPPPPPGEVNAAYSTALTVNDGTAPFTWTVGSGNLPDGISLDPVTGVLRGTPTTAGSATAVIRVTDSAGRFATESATIVIAAAPAISSGPPPDGEVGAAYTFPFTVSGGTGPFTWSVVSGTPPDGLTLNASTGVLSGTPTAPAGSHTFTVRVVDSFAVADSQAVTLVVAGRVGINPVAPPAGEVSVPYTLTYTASGGAGPYTWSISAGALPAGLSLAPSTGVVSGTPTAAGAGSSTFTVRVVDGQAQAATMDSTIVIAAVPRISSGTPAPGEVRAAYSFLFTVSDGSGPFTWSVSSGTLPDGLSLNPATGALTGTPTASGSTTFSVKVVDAFSLADTASVTVVVVAAPLITSGPPPSGEVGDPYTFQYTVSGGTGPFTWSLASGAIPDGLNLRSGTGRLVGTPTTVGLSNFTVRVTDSLTIKNTKADSLLVVAGPSIDPTVPPAGEIGVGYSVAYSVTGGTGPFIWSISAGALPTGLSLAPSTGVVSGTPLGSAGTASFTVRVTDGMDQVATLDSSIRVVAAPTVSYPDTVGTQGTPLLVDPVVVGGTAPFGYAVTGPALPTGLSLNQTTGRISGTPTQGGVYAPQITLTDTFGATSTQVANFAISFSATITLFASASSVDLGDTVVLTATVGPGSPTGTVEFDVVPSSGPDAGRVMVLGTTGVAVDGTATWSLAASTFGANAYTAIYSGDGTHSGVASAVRPVEVAATVGEVVVEEMRMFGPNGARDSYVQLVNLTDVSVPLAGFTLTGASGQLVIVPPTAPLLQPGHAYLLAGSAFSLNAFASPDLTYALSLGAGGIRVAAPDTATTVTDAVGSAGGFSSGTPLPVLPGPSSVQQAWTRQINYNDVQDTADNLADFNLVSVTGGIIGGVQSVLGSPAPTGTADPARNNPALHSSLLDTGRTGAQPPNRVLVKGVGGQPGSLIVRRTVTNSTAATITAAALRITAISQAHGRPPPGSGRPPNVVDLTLVDPATGTSQVTLSDGSTVTVDNLSISSTVGVIGGGLNSVLTVPLPPGGLAPGQSVDVALTFTYTGTGAFWFAYDADLF